MCRFVAAVVVQKQQFYHFTGLLCSFLSNRSVYAGGFDRLQICKTVKSKKRDSSSKEHEMEVKPSECSFLMLKFKD